MPLVAQTHRFRLRPITVHDVIPDYDAVMTSLENLQGSFGPRNDWPKASLSLDQDLRDLSWHQKEFQDRRSFTYAVFNRDESQEIGAVYIFPPGYFYGGKKQKFDAQVILWVRKSELVNELDQVLFDFTRYWLKQKWPFKNVAFPGRSISWADWMKIP